jgi:ammonia channel protein AmtB
MLELGACELPTTHQRSLLRLKILGGVTSALSYLLLGYNIFMGSFNFMAQIFQDRDFSQGPAYVWTADWSFHFAFALNCASIVTGSVVGRIKISGYLLGTVVITALIQPIAAWMIWNPRGILTEQLNPQNQIPDPNNVPWGLFKSNGFLDFAGGMVVHSVGGICALVAAVFVGRRDPDPDLRRPPHNEDLAVLGTLILWLGWYGFNAGSTNGLTDDRYRSAANITANCTIAAATGGLFAAFDGRWRVLARVGVCLRSPITLCRKRTVAADPPALYGGGWAQINLVAQRAPSVLSDSGGDGMDYQSWEELGEGSNRDREWFENNFGPCEKYVHAMETAKETYNKLRWYLSQVDTQPEHSRGADLHALIASMRKTCDLMFTSKLSEEIEKMERQGAELIDKFENRVGIRGERKVQDGNQDQPIRLKPAGWNAKSADEWDAELGTNLSCTLEEQEAWAKAGGRELYQCLSALHREVVASIPRLTPDQLKLVAEGLKMRVGSASTVDLLDILNGVLVGLVASSSSGNVLPPFMSVPVGIVAVIFYRLGKLLTRKLYVDDPMGAFAVHCMGGISGCLMVPLGGFFQNKDPTLDRWNWFYNHDFFGDVLTQFGVQLWGILVIVTWTLFCATITFGSLYNFNFLADIADWPSVKITPVFEHGQFVRFKEEEEHRGQRRNLTRFQRWLRHWNVDPHRKRQWMPAVILLLAFCAAVQVAAFYVGFWWNRNHLHD